MATLTAEVQEMLSKQKFIVVGSVDPKAYVTFPREHYFIIQRMQFIDLIFSNTNHREI